MNVQTYASSKNLKGIDRKKSSKGKHDDFDGTPQSLAPTEEHADHPQESKTPKKSKERSERKGMTYCKQAVGTLIIHKSDYSRIPEEAVVISSSYKKVRNIVSHIEEHHFEELKIKHPDGRIEKIYLPIKDEPSTELYKEILPDTHITANLQSYLLFNCYQMAIPAHREAKNRLIDMDWHTSSQNLLNWVVKGALQLNKLIPSLKSVVLSEGSNVNVDETWLRYHTVDEKRKTYMWCPVNKEARIVIFFYEDTEDKDGNQKHGGRSRNVLLDFYW